MLVGGAARRHEGADGRKDDRQLEHGVTDFGTWADGGTLKLVGVERMGARDASATVTGVAQNNDLMLLNWLMITR